MGRAFANRYSEELGIPRRLDDWSNDQILIALGRRGEDSPGNLILGQESAERWERREYTSLLNTQRNQYPQMARNANQGQPTGSSAGGEQPKFSAFIDDKHVIVKYVGSGEPAHQRRWRDLLICEAIALDVLREHGNSAAEATIYEIEGSIFLEIARFDRVGLKGRRALLTLAAISDYFYGSRDNWSLQAEKMESDGKISSGCIWSLDRRYRSTQQQHRPLSD
jgi:hypothetical protein